MPAQAVMTALNHSVVGSSCVWAASWSTRGGWKGPEHACGSVSGEQLLQAGWGCIVTSSMNPATRLALYWDARPSNRRYTDSPASGVADSIIADALCVCTRLVSIYHAHAEMLSLCMLLLPYMERTSSMVWTPTTWHKMLRACVSNTLASAGSFKVSWTWLSRVRAENTSCATACACEPGKQKERVLVWWSCCVQ